MTTMIFGDSFEWNLMTVENFDDSFEWNSGEIVYSRVEKRA